ncbi:MAG: amidohydrolase family protein, partial [Gemmatimonadaceae bacterium]
RQLTQLGNPDGYEGGAAWSDSLTIVFARLQAPNDSAFPWPSRLARINATTGDASEIAVDSTAGRNLRDPAWEPGGRRFAVVSSGAAGSRGGRLWLVESATGHAIPLTAGTVRALAPAFAPDGRRISYFAPDSLDRTQLWVASVDSLGAASPVRLTSHADLASTRSRWTPDGKALLYSADGRLWKVPASGGAPSEIPFTATLAFERPRVALPAPKFPQPGETQHVRAFMGLSLSPDARSVAIIALGRLWLMPIDSAPRALADVPLSAHHLAWSPDAKTLAWAAGPHGQEDIFTTDLATGATHQMTALRGSELSPMYSPDGRHLAFLHQPSEGSTIVRIVAPNATALKDATAARSFAVASGAEMQWSPASNAILLMTGGWSPLRPTKGELVSLTGKRRALARVPDSPLSLVWSGRSITYVRHARLWRASFDSTGMLGEPEPLETEPAMYPSVARDGTLLFISEGGLRLRAPDGTERRLGWPLEFTPPVAEPLVIQNARIIDGSGKAAGPARDILVERGRITRIADAGTLPTTGRRALNAEGRFVMPGLMDLHAHVYRPELLPGFSYFGVTTVRDQGSPLGPLVAYADAAAAGKLFGPRVDYGGFQFYSDWAFDTEDGQGVEPEADPDHAARAIALAQIFGSHHIKARTFRRWDINARFINEAHRRGMRITGHCAHELPLIAAGTDAKEHAGFCATRSDGVIYDDIVQLYRAAGIGVVPTITYSAFAVALNQNPKLLDDDAELATFAPAASDFNWMIRLDSAGRQMFSGFASSARLTSVKLARAGVTLGTGSDIWQVPTGVHGEMQELVAAGLSPLQAIHAATGAAARIIGAERDFGTVEVGKLADLVILDADPVADIRNTRKIWAVLQSGQIVDRAAIRASVHAVARPK